MPLSTIASAVSRTSASEMNGPKRFHEFQPMGGVRASPSLRTPNPTLRRILGRLGLLRRARGIERHEVRVAGHLEELRRERRRLSEEAARVDELLEDVARVARAQPDVLLAVDREDLAHRLGAI